MATTVQLFDGAASLELPFHVVELGEPEKIDFFGKGEVPQYAYSIPRESGKPMIWSIHRSDLPAEQADMAAARTNYRNDLEDFFEGAEWLSDQTLDHRSRTWELLEFRTSGLHRWVYLTPWQGHILSCEFNAFNQEDAPDVVRQLFEGLVLDPHESASAQV